MIRIDEEIAYKQTASGLIVPAHVSTRKKPTAFSLFSGAGGFDLGFVKAGWDVVGANEYEADAALTYMVNLCSYPVQIHYIDGQADKERLNKALIRSMKFHKKHTSDEIYNKTYGSGCAGSGWIRHHPDIEGTKHFWFGDVRKLRGEDILEALGMLPGEIDCVFGGPPCQGFSRAGQRNIADPRNNLVYEFGRIITELRPKTWVMENVPDIATMFDPDGIPVLEKLAMIVEEGGYGRWQDIKKMLEMQSGAAAVPMQKKKGAGKKKDDKSVLEDRQLTFEEVLA